MPLSRCRAHKPRQPTEHGRMLMRCRPTQPANLAAGYRLPLASKLCSASMWCSGMRTRLIHMLGKWEPQSPPEAFSVCRALSWGRPSKKSVLLAVTCLKSNDVKWVPEHCNKVRTNSSPRCESDAPGMRRPFRCRRRPLSSSQSKSSGVGAT